MSEGSGRKVIGIIGGMGPEATADLYLKIIEETGASCDQQHLDVVIVSDPTVADRTRAILGSGPDPAPQIIRSASRCVRAGADFLIMPCNAAHHFHPQVQGGVEVPVVHMIDEVVRHLREEHPEVRAVGIMAASGTVASGMYQRFLADAGIEALVPDEGDQDLVMEGIYAVKSGQHRRAGQLFPEVAERMLSAGAGAIIAGCTEIPLGLRELPSGILIDATRVLARAAVRIALGDREFPPGGRCVRN